MSAEKESESVTFQRKRERSCDLNVVFFYFLADCLLSPTDVTGKGLCSSTHQQHFQFAIHYNFGFNTFISTFSVSNLFFCFQFAIHYNLDFKLLFQVFLFLKTCHFYSREDHNVQPVINLDCFIIRPSNSVLFISYTHLILFSPHPILNHTRRIGA